MARKDLSNRSATYHRKQIRDFCGFRCSTSQDAEDLRDWLHQTVLPQTLDPQTLQHTATQRLRGLNIEAMSFGRLQQTINAAIRIQEQQFSQEISKKLSPEAQKFIDRLLTRAQTEHINAVSGSGPQSKIPTFNFLVVIWK